MMLVGQALLSNTHDKMRLTAPFRKGVVLRYTNRSFLSCHLPLCQNDSSHETIQWKGISLYVHFHVDQTHFLMRGLGLKQRFKVARKWSTTELFSNL